MKMKNTLCLLLALLMVLSLTACGGSSKAADNEAYYDAMEPVEVPGAGLNTSEEAAATPLPSDRKLIRTISIEAETEDLTTLVEDLTARITQLGGYVEAKNQRNGSNYASYRTRNLQMTVRIPAEQADAFVEKVSQNANIVSSSETVDDVTLQYVDTESQVKALETEQERLLQLLEQAESLKDILEIEERLTQVRYELERFASRLRTLDNQIDYATIHLSVTEVKEYTPVAEEEPTVWEQIAGGFVRSLKDIGESLKDFFVWFVVNSPYLVLWGLIGAAVILLLRRRKTGWRLRKQKKTTPPEKTE